MAIAAFLFKMRRWLACLLTLLVLLREHGTFLPATLAGFAYFPIEELREVLFFLLWQAEEDAVADMALRAVFYEWMASRSGSLPWLQLVKTTASSFLHFSREGAFSMRIHTNAIIYSQRIQALWGFPCTWGPLPSLQQWQRWFEDMAVLRSLPPCDVSAGALVPAEHALGRALCLDAKTGEDGAMDAFSAPLQWDTLAEDEEWSAQHSSPAPSFCTSEAGSQGCSEQSCSCTIHSSNNKEFPVRARFCLECCRSWTSRDGSQKIPVPQLPRPLCMRLSAPSTSNPRT